MIKKRSGQLTIFIILGLALVISFGIILYLQYEGSIFRPAPPIKDLIPTPIREYVDSCISQTAMDAISILTLQGGYIYLPDEINTNKESYLKLTPDGELKLPLWYFRGRDNSPRISRMERDISDYITQNIGGCLDNLSSFRDEYDIKELGPLSADTVIAENDLTVTLNYPLELSQKLQERKLSVSRFSKTVNVKLKKIFDLALKVFNQENNDLFFEDFTINLIAANEEMTPYTGFEINCNKKTWLYTKVSSNVESMIETNLPFIKVTKTSYQDIPDIVGGISASYMKNHFYWDFLDKDYGKYKISFEYYPNYPMQLVVRPRNGMLLESNSMEGQQALRYLCFNIWHFTYDVRYPIKTTIIDTSDPINPLSFTFGFEVSINHNKPDKTNYPIREIELADYISNNEWCIQNNVTNINVQIEDEASPTFYGLDGVNVSLICGPVSCDVGMTTFDYDGINAQLITKAPYCVQGIMRLSKPGYIDKEFFLDTVKDTFVEESMVPIQEFPEVVVMKHEQSDPGIAYGLGIAANESAFIKISNDTYTSYTVYPNSSAVPLTMLAKKDVSYDLEIYLFKNEELIGGYKGLWEPKWDDLSSASEIVFHTIYINSSDENEIMLLMSEIELHSMNVPLPEVK